jgi:protoheme IX farnesyltransferase
MSGSKSSDGSFARAASLPPEARAEHPLGLTVHTLPEAGEAVATAQRARHGRWKMLGVLLICAAPVVASYFTYYVIRPEGRRVYGELINPQRTVPALTASTLDGGDKRLESLKGQWLLVSVAGGDCDPACQKHLYLQRQLRESLGKEKDRVDWVWLINDNALPPAALTPALQQATVLRVEPSALKAWLEPAQGQQRRRQGQAGPGAPAARFFFVGRAGAAGQAMTDTQPLYDLAPVLELMLLGLVIALGPLVWVWARNRRSTPMRRLQALTVLTLFLTFDLVGARAEIAAAQEAMPTGPVTHGKAWIEMIHRYLATGVGVLIIVITVSSWVQQRRARRDGGQPAPPLSPWWPTVTLLWVCLQGAFGALTVTMKLFPAIVTNGPAAGPASRAGWLGQHQLCGAGMHHLPHLPGQLVARHGLCAGLPDLAQAGHVARRQPHQLCCAHRHSLRAPPDGLCGAAGTGPGGLALPSQWRVAYAGPVDWRAGPAAAGDGFVQRGAGLAPGGCGVAHLRCCCAGGGAYLGPGVHPRGARAPRVFRAHGRIESICMSVAPSAVAAPPSRFQQFYALTKPRVVQLIVFCALIGMVLAVPGLPNAAQLGHMALACLGVWLVAGAAAAFNCIVEQGIDAKMKRTAWRPTAKGELSNAQTLLFSAVLCAVGSVLLYVWINPLTMWLTFATFVGYAVVYTVILKPLTPQNIVIGGASGAMPPVLGWAAMTNDVGPEALILFLIIFLWTPPHFWALALYRVEDYRKSGLPMLPVTHGNEFTRLQVFLYTLILLAGCMMPFIYGMSSWIYLAAAVLLSLGFCGYAFALWRNYSDALARKTFRFSLIHLSVLFAALLVDHYVL